LVSVILVENCIQWISFYIELWRIKVDQILLAIQDHIFVNIRLPGFLDFIHFSLHFTPFRFWQKIISRYHLKHNPWVVSQKLNAFAPLVLLSQILIIYLVLLLYKINDFLVVDSFICILAHRHTFHFVDNVEQTVLIDQASFKVVALIEKEVYANIV